MSHIRHRASLLKGPSAGGVTTLHSDTFTDTDAVEITAHVAGTRQSAYSVLTGASSNMTINGNRGRFESAGTAGQHITASAGQATHVIECDFKTTLINASNGIPTIHTRVLDVDNRWQFRVYNGSLQIYEVTTGTLTLRASATLASFGVSWSNDTWYHFKLTTTSAGLTGIVTFPGPVDATISYSSTTHNTRTGFGFGSYHGTGSQYTYIDGITVVA